MWTDVQFWKDSTWRGFRTFCQTLAAMLGGQAVNILTADWMSMLSVSATAALVSLLMSIDRGRVTTTAEPVAQVASAPEIVIENAAAPTDLDAPTIVGCGGDLR